MTTYAVLAFMLGALLRVLQLQARSLWFDEAKTLLVAQAPLGQLGSLVRSLEGIPPLYFALAHLWTRAFSDPLSAIRWLSAVCGIAALPLYLAFCRRACPDSWKPAFALGCVSSFWLHLSQDGRVYSPLLLASLAQAYLFLRLLSSWTVRDLLGQALMGTVALYLHPFYGFSWLATTLYGAFALTSEPLKRRWFLSAQACCVLAVLPWLPSLLAQMAYAHTSLLSRPLSAAAAAEAAGTMLVDIPFLSLAGGGLLRLTGAAALGALLSGAVTALRTGARARDARLSCVCLFLAPMAMARAAEWTLHRPLCQARYFTALSPFLYAGLFASMPRGRWRPACQALVLLVAAAGAVAYHSLAGVLDPGLPGLSRELAARTSPGERVVHLQAFYYPPMRYYYLPDRRHELLCPEDRLLTWKALPGYPAAAAPLSPTTRYAVVDPERRLFASRIGFAHGRDLLELCPRDGAPGPAS